MDDIGDLNRIGIRLMFSHGLGLGSVEALRLAQAEARWRRWWNTMFFIILGGKRDNRAVVVVAGAALGACASRGMSRERVAAGAGSTSG
jgi:hypothetical protein